MVVRKVSWRKVPRPGKDDVIRTRLILPSVFPAVKKHAIQRGSVRTICLCKCPSRTAREGRDQPCLQFRYTPLPCSQKIPTCLPKSMLVAVPTHSRQSQNYAYNSSKKRMRPIMGASSYRLFGSIFVHFQQDLE